MHLIETYALSCGVPIEKPFIDTEFYPTDLDRYIIVHGSTGMESKIYSYFQDVIDELAPILNKNGIGIIQIGLQNDTPIIGVDDFRGKTTLRQTAYLIENCELVLGGDSFSSHMAGGFNKPLVCLFGIIRPENCRPYWGDKSKQIILCPDFSQRKPTYSSKESIKRIDEIKPEEVINSVLKLLNLGQSDYETYFIGKNYTQDVIEMILNEPPMEIKNGSLNIRLDKNNHLFNPNYLAKCLRDSVCNLIVDKPFDLKAFAGFKSRIKGISYNISNGYDQRFIDDCCSLGIFPTLETDKEEDLNNLRFKFFDFDVDLNPKSEKIDIKNLQASVKTRKSILCGGKRYISMAHYDKGLDTSVNIGILDEESFWKDKEYYYLYGTKNIKTTSNGKVQKRRKRSS